MGQAFAYIGRNLNLQQLYVSLEIDLGEDCCDESWAKSLIQINGLYRLTCPIGSTVEWTLYPERSQIEEGAPRRQRRIAKLLEFLADNMLAHAASSKILFTGDQFQD